MKLFRVIVSINKRSYAAPNDRIQISTNDVQKVSAIRWNLEEFHREFKQLTGIESCQCRKARIQKNHIACVLLVWARLKSLAYKTGKTIYQIKYGLLSNYLIEQRKRPVQCLLSDFWVPSAKNTCDSGVSPASIKRLRSGYLPIKLWLFI